MANALKKILEIHNVFAVSKLVLFTSKQVLENQHFTNQIDIYEEVLGSQLRTEKVPLDSNGLGKVDDFANVFRENSLKYIDLTNGQKSITAQLYLAASLLRIKNIYSLSLLVSPKEIPKNPVWNEHYKYVHLPPFTGISDLSKLSYFDLIFYLEEIEEIFSDAPANSFIRKISNDLRKSISSFFQGDNSRSAVVDATTGSEGMINTLLDFLLHYPPARKICHDLYIDLSKQKDPLGAVTFFFRKYSEASSKNRKYLDKDLEPILTVPSLLTPLRMFRNISAHAGISPHQFEANEVRVCINLALEIFRCAKMSKSFWSKLLTL
ncbi:hypothetical protein [Synechococcus elongatus]|uniref:hypothetical protein n=1 Tax=Synechococcus elongatus TaxID=32046 RepID=UPI0030D04C50